MRDHLREHRSREVTGPGPHYFARYAISRIARVPVQNLFDYLEGASSLEDFLEDFPSVSRETAVAVLEQARERLFADAPSS